MSNQDIAEILRLPPEERLRLMELIWERLAIKPATIPIGDAHKAAIDEALAEHRSNPDDVISVAQAFAEVRKSR